MCLSANLLKERCKYMTDTQQDRPLEQYSTLTSSQEDGPTKTSPGSARDLATVGGGNIPGGGSVSKDSALPPESGVPSNEAQEQQNNANTVDKHAQTNLGGRNPGQGGSSMGDQDRTQSRPGDDPTDPMTSRTPDQLKKQA